MRALQQQNTGYTRPTVTVVNTPQQLMDAVVVGASYIEIRAHLDLTTLIPRVNDKRIGLQMLSDDRVHTRDVGHTIQVQRSSPTSKTI